MVIDLAASFPVVPFAVASERSSAQAFPSGYGQACSEQGYKNREACWQKYEVRELAGSSSQEEPLFSHLKEEAPIQLHILCGSPDRDSSNSSILQLPK